jgi:hypothetical protein
MTRTCFRIRLVRVPSFLWQRSQNNVFLQVSLSLRLSEIPFGLSFVVYSVYMHTSTAITSIIYVLWASKVRGIETTVLPGLIVTISAHLNTSYRHFFLFINEVSHLCSLYYCCPLIRLFRSQFDLVDKKELAPLDELNEAILAEDKNPR